MDAVRLPRRSHSAVQPAQRLRFAGFELDPASGELSRGGEPVPLQPQPARLLTAFALRPGRVILRQELEDLLWSPEQHVDREQGLNYCIRQVRQALGDSGSHPEFVETLPRRGYRFLPAVERVEPAPAAPATDNGAAPAAAPDGPPDGGPRRRRPPSHVLRRTLPLLMVVAVGLVLWALAKPDRTPPAGPTAASPRILAIVPLETIEPGDAPPAGGDADADFLAAGLTEELATTLGRSDPRSLAVLAPGAAARKRHDAADLGELGRSLGADYLLAGSVLRSETHLRVAVRLVATADQTQLWSETYEAGVGDAFRVQSDIAQAVAEALSLRLPLTPSTADEPHPEAFEAYLRGVHLQNQPLPRPDPVPHLRRAVELDPDFARAWTELARAYRLRRPFRGDDLAHSRAALERALELDPDSPHAHLEGGLLAFRRDFDLTTAQRHLRRSLEIHPAYATSRMRYGAVLSALGQHRRADEELRRALTLDPDSLVILGDLGWFAFFARDYEAAAAGLQGTLGRDPGGAGYWSRRCLLAVYVSAQRWRDAEALVTTWPADALAGTPTAAVPGDPRATVHAFLRREAVRLEQLMEEGYLAPAVPAANHALLGDGDAALDLLERSVDEGWGWSVPFLRVDPRFDALRAEPRFVRLLQRLGLPDPRQAEAGPPPRTRLAILTLCAMDVDPTFREGMSPSLEQVAAGFTEELTSEIGRLDPRRLGVLSRSAVFPLEPHGGDPQDVVDQLGADYLLEGSLRNSGDTLRLVVRLVDGTDHTQVWTGAYDLATDGSPQAQREVAHRIATSVAAHLSI